MASERQTIVIGGGAAGLAAAVMLARAGERVTIVEKATRVGKKLLATGNGTCNITNRLATDGTHYHGAPAAFTETVLSQFTPRDCLAFFESIGVVCTSREEGREYPLCGQAAAVLDCLRGELKRLGVVERCDTVVRLIKPNKKALLVMTDTDTLTADHVVLAVGGAASPSLGGSADGYALATALGHQKKPLFPSIVQVKTDVTYIKAMKGLRCDAAVTFFLNGKPIGTRTDELLFTEYGLSGPAVMHLSRAIGDWERRKQGTMNAVLDLLPTMSDEAVERYLRTRPTATAEDFLTGLLHKRIGQTVCRAAGFALTQSMTALNDEEIHTLVSTIKRFTVNVTGTQGFGGAQVTAGGIDTAEIDPHTMESRIVPRVYLIGEMVDVDGDCGGYNLQWAWASAHVAARAVSTQ